MYSHEVISSKVRAHQPFSMLLTDESLTAYMQAAESHAQNKLGLKVQNIYLLNEVKVDPPGKRHLCNGCCGREWLAGSEVPGITSTGTAPAS